MRITGDMTITEFAKHFRRFLSLKKRFTNDLSLIWQADPLYIQAQLAYEIGIDG